MSLHNNRYGIKGWTETFFSQLRSLVYQGFLRHQIRYVIAGSSKIIDVREQGSPLLNMLNINYLNALEKKDTLKIINWADNVPLDVIKFILKQCGGHPFITQYLMHQIWDANPSTVTIQSVIAMINKFMHEREADLEKWLVDIGQEGQMVYQILGQSTRWQTEAQLRQLINNPDLKIGRGLTILCCHGLAIHNDAWSKYCVSGMLFKGWFQNNILPSLNSSNILNSSQYSTSNKGHRTISTIPKASITTSTPKLSRTHAFISYCHKDKKLLDELQSHLAPYSRLGLVDVWVDSNIYPGSKWREEIEKALQNAKIAILLVSAEYLKSEFITNVEIPSLLEASEQGGAIIFSVILRPCAFTITELAQYQAVNSPSKPLSKLKNRGERDEVWSRVAELVRDALNKI